MIKNASKFTVAVIGAGPAGLFAARELAHSGVEVALINRDIKPGGLAEYGIYPEKNKVREALRSQFRLILAENPIHYFGNVTVGNHADVSLDQMMRFGFDGMLITVGAQGTKWLGLPGEQLSGVYHAKDLVFHYNRLPPYSQLEFNIGKKAAIVGIGNVMTDITRYLVSVTHVDEVIAIARRGPGEIKFDKKELEAIAGYLDLKALDEEIDRSAALMRSLGQNPDVPRSLIHSIHEKCAPPGSKPCTSLRFLLSPTQILGDEQGHVRALEVEENTLTLEEGEIRATGTGRRRMLDVDTVIFAIGDAVDHDLGLPVGQFEYVKNPDSRFKVEDISYEVFDPSAQKPLEGVFIAGWSRKASTGLVGVARKDGTNGARAVLQYLDTLPKPSGTAPLENLRGFLSGLGKAVIEKEALTRLEQAENEQAGRLGLEYYKFSSNEEMLAAIRQPA